MKKATTAMIETQQAREIVKSSSRLRIEVLQVLDSGCLALDLDGDYKRVFIDGLVSGDLAEGQKGVIRAQRDGVFKYTTVQGGSSTIEKWRFVAAD